MVLKQWFGNHSDGLKVERVSLTDEYFDFSTRPAFFFHGKSLKIPKSFDDTITSVKIAQKQETELLKKLADQKKVQESIDKAIIVLKLLAD